jgi:hypothetical protein
MVRLFFVEQLYRAFTIIKGEPYHHSWPKRKNRQSFVKYD